MLSDEWKTDFFCCLQICWQFLNKSDLLSSMSKTSLFLSANQLTIDLKPFGHNATSTMDHTRLIHDILKNKITSLTQPHPLSEVNWGSPIGTNPRLYVHQSLDWTSRLIVSNSETSQGRYTLHLWLFHSHLELHCIACPTPKLDHWFWVYHQVQVAFQHPVLGTLQIRYPSS